ncbi:MAG: hypothetical protein IPM49_00135 [Flavobacteriales bacterium]|nr:hypothetical protein [Flavobacteriales bacterium]
MGETRTKKHTKPTSFAQCAVCGRRLTSPASIAAGVGPVCGKSPGRGHKHALAIHGSSASSGGAALATAPDSPYSCPAGDGAPRPGEVPGMFQFKPANGDWQPCTEADVRAAMRWLYRTDEAMRSRLQSIRAGIILMTPNGQYRWLDDDAVPVT